MIVIFNTNGSIYDTELADYVQQGSNGANRLQVAYVDSMRSGLSAYLIAERPNGTSITLPAHKASFDCNGERYQGWEVTITGSFTLYAGVVHCTLNIVDEDDQIQANYPFDVTVNATGNPIDADWDEQINVAQYNAFMAMLSGKATINRVESKDELPVPGQRSVLWLVGTDKYDAYAWDPESEEYRTILNGVYVVQNIAQDDISGLPNGQLIYDESTSAYYEKTDTSPYYAKALGGAGVLGAPNILCRSDDSTRTIAQLHTIYGDSAYIVLRYLDKDYLYFSKKTNSTYTCVAFDIEEQRFYKASGLSGSALPSTILIPVNKIEIASKALLVSDYVPYNGANADVDLGEHKISAKELDLPNSKIRTDSIDDNATLLDGKFLYDNEHTDEKEDERAVASVKYALEQHIKLTTSDGGAFTSTQYAYISKHNATIVDKSGKTYRFINEDDINIYYGCFNGETNTSLGATPIRLGNILKVAKTPSNNEYDFVIQEVNFEVYSTSQAKDKFATDFTWEIDNTTYVMTLNLKNANGGYLRTRTLDLPLESIVSSATYYDTYTYEGTTYTKVIVIALSTTSVPTIVPVGDLISGLEKEACVEIPVSPTSGTFTSAQMELLALDNASIKIGGYTYLHKVLANQFIAKSAVVSADGYKTVSEYKVVVQNNGDYALTLTTTSFYDKTQIDAKVANLETAIGEKDTITDLQENKKYSYQYLVNSNGELILRLTEIA